MNTTDQTTLKIVDDTFLFCLFVALVSGVSANQEPGELLTENLKLVFGPGLILGAFAIFGLYFINAKERANRLFRKKLLKSGLSIFLLTSVLTIILMYLMLFMKH